MGNIFKKWKEKRAIVIGDVMLDRYLHGNTERISPEAPIPILDLDTQYDRLGGAANVALNIQSLGAKVELFGFVGKDKDAFSFLEEMENVGLDNSHILPDSLHLPRTKQMRMARVSDTELIHTSHLMQDTIIRKNDVIAVIYPNSNSISEILYKIIIAT